MYLFSKSILCCFLVLIFFSCKPEADKTKPATSETPPAAVPSGPAIPGLPQDVMIKLLNECTYIDYIFHVLPFSLSQSEDPSIDQNIAFIDINSPLGTIPTGCKADARKFFQIKGEIVYDVDVYITKNCKFYVFVDKNNKPMYANKMTQAGINFYENIIKQAAGMNPQQ